MNSPLMPFCKVLTLDAGDTSVAHGLAGSYVLAGETAVLLYKYADGQHEHTDCQKRQAQQEGVQKCGYKGVHDDTFQKILFVSDIINTFAKVKT